jgi:hypothetical protein
VIGHNNRLSSLATLSRGRTPMGFAALGANTEGVHEIPEIQQCGPTKREVSLVEVTTQQHTHLVSCDNELHQKIHEGFLGEWGARLSLRTWWALRVHTAFTLAALKLIFPAILFTKTKIFLAVMLVQVMP